jgi:hypothetical protein
MLQSFMFICMLIRATGGGNAVSGCKNAVNNDAVLNCCKEMCFIFRVWYLTKDVNCRLPPSGNNQSRTCARYLFSLMLWCLTNLLKCAVIILRQKWARCLRTQTNAYRAYYTMKHSGST